MRGYIFRLHFSFFEGVPPDITVNNKYNMPDKNQPYAVWNVLASAGDVDFSIAVWVADT